MRNRGAGCVVFSRSKVMLTRQKYLQMYYGTVMAQLQKCLRMESSLFISSNHMSFTAMTFLCEAFSSTGADRADAEPLLSLWTVRCAALYGLQIYKIY
jgi:23S rRNA G2069 N7-methylase RlmK/C1962 C5-methylase RlmI